MHTKVAAAVGSMTLLLGCQGPNRPSSPQHSTAPDLSPPGVPAIVEVEASTGTVGKSPRSPVFGYRLRQPLTVRETFGRGANLDSFRLRITRHGLEETELLSSADIIAQTGSNRLTALTARSMTLRIDFNTLPADRMVGEILYTGDDGLTRSVSLDLVPGIVFPEVVD